MGQYLVEKKITLKIQVDLFLNQTEASSDTQQKNHRVLLFKNQ